ncbi:GNAT family N-acetyltransferase [Roseospirillum parvum]|uniref:L-ornithine N(alpha)-acyltransferase n=1 Tax=Roseospirillum parvum TaxID=83401 RepID=A0A1G8DN47_9PROT|nr:GNAT family N-acyltransferase [Roseospirillum parvum]SDH58929.1 Putative hemolysin [Roseospirillum parvum]
MSQASRSDQPAAPPGADDRVTAGNLEVRLARDESEVRAAQNLRYRVFYQEMGAHPTPEMAAAERDFDAFDETCDHLLVLDHNLGRGAEAIVACYRLARRAHAARAGRFYTADEYDISRLEAFSGEILELGRSCVDNRYRDRAIMQLLWRGIAAYVFRHDIDIMFGCASLHGTDPDQLAPQLSYLVHNHLAPEALRPVALAERCTEMRRLAREDYDPKRALASLAPLVKGYLRLGGWVGDGAVIDYQFNTTDVCIVVKTDQVTEKYLRHYDRTARDTTG